MTSHWRTSGLARGELTFGAVGRVVATIVFLSPVFFALPYLTMVVPQGLRRLGQPAPVEFVEDPLPAAAHQADPPSAAGGIAGRWAPSRW